MDIKYINSVQIVSFILILVHMVEVGHVNFQLIMIML